MLVVEDRHAAAVGLEHFDALLEELVARVLNLPLGVDRIVAMLADDHDAVDGQLIAAAAKRLGDRRIDLEAELFGARSSL